MSNLHDTVKALMIDVLLAGDDNDVDPSEEIVYRPYGGTARTIRAIVTRSVGEMGNANTPMITIRVANDATSGILSSSFDLGADQVDVSERPGDAVKTRNFRSILSDNPAFMRLEVN